MIFFFCGYQGVCLPGFHQGNNFYFIYLFIVFLSSFDFFVVVKAPVCQVFTKVTIFLGLFMMF
jgi:hypothetical protein